MIELSERIDDEYDKADPLDGRCVMPRDTLLGWKNEVAQLEDYKRLAEERLDRWSKDYHTMRDELLYALERIRQHAELAHRPIIERIAIDATIKARQ